MLWKSGFPHGFKGLVHGHLASFLYDCIRAEYTVEDKYWKRAAGGYVSRKKNESGKYSVPGHSVEAGHRRFHLFIQISLPGVSTNSVQNVKLSINYWFIH